MLKPALVRCFAGILPLLAVVSECPAAEAPPPWRATLDKVASDRDRLSASLGSAHKTLKARLEAERPDLLPKLDPVPPKPLPTGYGILPPLVPNGPESVNPAPHVKGFGIGSLAQSVVRELELAAALTGRVSAQSADLPAAVDEYWRRKEAFRLMDSSVRYHELWQTQAPSPLPERSPLNLAYDLWRSTPADEAARARAQEAAAELERVSTAFNPVPWHSIVRAGDGLLLRVPFMTDIEDSLFLSSAAAALEGFYNLSPAMVEAGLRVEIAWIAKSSAALYPEGPPKHGQHVDLSAHLTRFGPGYALTTGASALHLLGNRGIMLGPEGVSGRVLAHELAHIFGFADGYIRTFERGATPEDGASIREITAFPEGLMADPGGGRVTRTMVRLLLDAYHRPAP